MDAKLILSALAAERPDVCDALKTVRSAGAPAPVQISIDTLSLFALNEYADRKRIQALAADLVVLRNDPPPHRGASPYHSLSHTATILVKRICEIAGIKHRGIAAYDGVTTPEGI